MRTQRYSPKLIQPTYTPALPKRHQMYSSELTTMTAQMFKEAKGALAQLRRIGVLGDDEHAEVSKDLEALVKKVHDLNQRERRAFADRVERDLGDELDEQALTEIKNRPDRTPFVPNVRIRKRLHACSANLLEFVDVTVEAMKRLRYSHYLSEADFIRYRSMVQAMPELRTELLDLMDKAGD